MSQSQPPQRQMSQRPGRRLPPARRLDYILIPAPHDLALASLTEKSPLPAIIVTPSSPTHSRDFAIAFLATPSAPSLFSRWGASVKEKVQGRWGKVKESVPVGFGSSWTRRRGGYVALPISAPPSPTSEFSIPTYPASEEKRVSKLATMVVAVVVVLVLCHFVAGVVMRSTVPVPSNGGVWASTTTAGDIVSTSPLVSPIVDAGQAAGKTAVVVDGVGKVVEGAASAKENNAYAYIGRVGVKQWFGWVVAGKKRTEVQV